MTKVIDSHGLIVFLEKEPGYEKIKSFFMTAVENRDDLLMTTVNYGEVFHILLREYNKDVVEDIEKTIHSLPIKVIDVDIEIAKEASRIKAKSKMSYTNCFSAALAKINKYEVITGDKEFKSIESEIKIDWI